MLANTRPEHRKAEANWWYDGVPFLRDSSLLARRKKDATRKKPENRAAIMIAAAIFAARDLAKDWDGGRSPRAIAAAANAIDKAKIPGLRNRPAPLLIPSRTTGQKALRALLAAGKIQRIGKGASGSRFRYFTT